MPPFVCQDCRAKKGDIYFISSHTSYNSRTRYNILITLLLLYYLLNDLVLVLVICQEKGMLAQHFPLELPKPDNVAYLLNSSEIDDNHPCMHV